MKVVILGCGRLGSTLARGLLAEDMKVVIADIEAGALDAAVAELSAGGEVIGVQTDVTDADSVNALADATYERFGACHVLVNNAGVGAPSAKIWETTVNDWRWVHGVNVMGVVNGILAFVPRMQRKDAIDRSLERFGLGDLRSQRVERLSMGQRQRVRLAMAFLHDPRLVLLDEPRTSLDAVGVDVLNRTSHD